MQLGLFVLLVEHLQMTKVVLSSPGFMSCHAITVMPCLFQSEVNNNIQQKPFPMEFCLQSEAHLHLMMQSNHCFCNHVPVIWSRNLFLPCTASMTLDL